MATTEWLLEQAAALEQAATDYAERAMWASLQDHIRQQARRIEQAEGELDGRAWDHQQW
ncbi:hypothetical protein [Lacticaseibacillus absianus]|uniref:hypothetical protein n=1 Tax=Lacticaseibacillus absianus TaxID=2729623 RepID=UPI0015CA9134|nr:hypothetical protein [Lacticaseibacillus absianus]